MVNRYLLHGQLKSGVCVVGLDDRRQVHLTREFHYAVGRDTIEA